MKTESLLPDQPEKSPSLLIKIDGKPHVVVPREAYVKAKAKQLREFGYSDLTEEHVSEQIDALLAGRTIGAGLTVIGAFMRGEVLEKKP